MRPEDLTPAHVAMIYLILAIILTVFVVLFYGAYLCAVRVARRFWRK